jgi:hypothetical protein
VNWREAERLIWRKIQAGIEQMTELIDDLLDSTD